MSEPLPDILWNEFGGALRMLEEALRACPPEVWGDRPAEHQFWYITYYTLFWADFYSSENPAEFQPPAPYTLGEFDPAGVYPERVYKKEELLTYLAFVKAKSKTLIGTLTPEKALGQQFITGHKDLSLLELLIYNTRHIQHHAAQLYLLLRQHTDSTPGWFSRPADGLSD